METINFKNCSLLLLERKFGLIDVGEHTLLTNWLHSTNNYEISVFEQEYFYNIQERLIYRVHDWNEIELIEHFIAPLFSLVNFNTKTYGMFSWRHMSATIGEYILSGNPDMIVAKGRREPEIPYFCFHEYKKEKDADSDPQGQCLAAMIVAQEQNNNAKPLYGVVVKGVNWSFMVLQGKEYAISRAYNATISELFEIVKLLKHLKTIIEEYVKS